MSLLHPFPIPIVGRDLATLLLCGVLAMVSSSCASPVSEPGGPLFYPSLPQRPRIEYLTRFARSSDLEGEPGWLMRFVVGDVASSRKLRKPTGVAAHDGVIYVVDPGWDSVLLLDLKEGVFDSLRDRGEGKLGVPVAIAIDGEGNKFIADTERRQVVQFNARNEYVGAFGNPEKLLPTGVAVDDQLLYVANRIANRVEVWNRRTGRMERSFGDFGKEAGLFNRPTSLSMDPNGHLFVTDSMNFRVQEFDSEGSYAKSYGFLGDGPGTFARPKGTAVDREGHLYTVDAAFENVQIWDTSNAHVLMAFGGPGVGPGEMYLPAAVSVDYSLAEYFRDRVDPDFELEYVVLVANNYGPNKLAVYGFVHPRDPSRYPEPPSPEEKGQE